MTRRLRTSALVAALTLGLVGGGAAVAATQSPAIKTFTPRTERQMTNIDVLRQQIRNYYGDPMGTGQFDRKSNYAKEAGDVAREGTRWLSSDRHGGKARASRQKAIVMDVDDTTLATYNYEIVSNWAYNPATNADYVLGQRFPAVPGMVQMARYAKAHGYAVFYLTGRPTSQEAATLGNLTSDGVGVDAGYPSPTALPNGEDGLFTKPDVSAYPDYLQAACASDPGGKCTTIHYKSATRAHIESLGYDLVASFGDQYSDFKGGYADRTFKLPNPSYYLP